MEGRNNRYVLATHRRGEGVKWKAQLRKNLSNNVMLAVEAGMKKYCPQLQVSSQNF